MARATLQDPLKTFRFTVELQYGGSAPVHYVVQTATVTYDTAKSKARIKLTAAVLPDRLGVCAELFSAIDTHPEHCQLTVRGLLRNGDEADDPGSIILSLPGAPMMSLSRTYDGSESGYLMDVLTIEVYGHDCPFT